MLDWLDPARLEADAIYLGVLTARRVKGLSRLEYPIAPALRRLLEAIGLRLATVTHLTQSGTQVAHLVMSLDTERIDAYLSEFDGTIIDGESPAIILAEARHFGYPACCADAFSRQGYAPNDLDPVDQRILFHHACAGCTETPRLLPAYRAALEESIRLYASFSAP
jgi:hypothetical protein